MLPMHVSMRFFLIVAIAGEIACYRETPGYLEGEARPELIEAEPQKRCFGERR